MLAFLHQQRPQAQATRCRNNVEGQNAPRFSTSRVSNDEAGDCLGGRRSFRQHRARDARIHSIAGMERGDSELLPLIMQFVKISHQRYRVTPGDEPAQIHLGIENTLGKAELIDLPQALEVGGAIVAEVKLHVSSLGLPWQAAQVFCTRRGIKELWSCARSCGD